MKSTNEFGEQVITVTLEELGPITDDEKAMIANARKMQQSFDQDCPPIPAEMHSQIRQDTETRKKQRSSAVLV
ncbi:MAG: hypothetical protein IJ058_04785 [Lachnospiraceae bacterium]|nr:hypothetical protein [Lachnospiraceae bacterium]